MPHLPASHSAAFLGSAPISIPPCPDSVVSPILRHAIVPTSDPAKLSARQVFQPVVAPQGVRLQRAALLARCAGRQVPEAFPRTPLQCPEPVAAIHPPTRWAPRDAPARCPSCARLEVFW